MKQQFNRIRIHWIRILSLLSLSYVTYEDKIWILYSNNMNDGYSSFHMKKYDGADHLVDEMNFEKLYQRIFD